MASGPGRTSPKWGDGPGAVFLEEVVSQGFSSQAFEGAERLPGAPWPRPGAGTPSLRSSSFLGASRGLGHRPKPGLGPVLFSWGVAAGARTRGQHAVQGRTARRSEVGVKAQHTEMGWPRPGGPIQSCSLCPLSLPCILPAGKGQPWPPSPFVPLVKPHSSAKSSARVLLPKAVSSDPSLTIWPSSPPLIS